MYAKAVRNCVGQMDDPTPATRSIDQHPGLAVVGAGSVVLFSGNGANITRTLPEIAAVLPNAVGREAVIRDGEILAPEAAGYRTG
jgi:hypothetical protein